MAITNGVGYRGFSRLAGVSDKAVRKAVASGFFGDLAGILPNGQPGILDAEKALAKWKAQRRPRLVRTEVQTVQTEKAGPQGSPRLPEGPQGNHAEPGNHPARVKDRDRYTPVRPDRLSCLRSANCVFIVWQKHGDELDLDGDPVFTLERATALLLGRKLIEKAKQEGADDL